ncbi:phage major capsid protein [Anaerobacillus isosaccharinicus]|uniref:Major capsid protein n=1 Tax=Anaerobacillus isosaccharinicus TaxID=1532552 RepID=A0A1S2L963_9BACI|nr:phage major capsid protein [Anaerobacillus isosaccharinicus]MBA5584570.1 phage major capsid protein [Anaerobacillus isosaccharinicus]QOY37049.1 phage major capsid protein [Anaerobacillus isosaccharinicus]
MTKSKELLKTVTQKNRFKLNLQFFSGKTLYELKQNMATIGQQLQKVEGELSAKAIDTTAKMEDIQALQQSKKDLQMRFDVIKEQHDGLEAEQKAKFAEQAHARAASLGNIDDPQQKVVKAKAELIRSTMRQKPIDVDVRAALGDDPTTGGGKFLPKTVSNDVIMEPLAKNPLRGHSALTNITNLEIPKLSYTLDDDDFIEDKATAKELELTGDTVSFGRHKFKVFAGVSETVLNGTDTNLVQHVENALKSGVAAKEKKVAFAKTPKAGEEHMSFYQTGDKAIKKVSGENLYKAIKAAIADLHEDYRENAKIFMTYADYSEIIETLANGNATLYTAQPEQVLGKPVIFADGATDPIVGDFAYSHFNYDIGELFERDKDIKTGIEQFVVTAWFDHQIKLKSAFRIAEVVATP